MSWEDYDNWLQIGIDKGWISAPVCVTHDGLPITDEEARMEEEEPDSCWDWCVPGVRLYGHEFVFEEEFPENPEKELNRHPIM